MVEQRQGQLCRTGTGSETVHMPKRSMRSECATRRREYGQHEGRQMVMRRRHDGPRGGTAENHPNFGNITSATGGLLGKFAELGVICDSA
jgi:hypothetical protein